MRPSEDIQPILAAYPSALRPSNVEFLASAGGFSGACFWRLTTGAGLMCLRRWPAECTPEKLRFIHSVLRHVARVDVPLIPVPIETTSGQTFVCADGYEWELARWMPGAADYRQHASNARLSAAMRALAEFHVAAASFPGTSTELRTPPSIVSRVGTLAAWQSGDVEQLRRTVSSSPESELTVLAQDIIDRFKPRMAELHDDLQGALPLRVRLQPCIRDIHDQHVLFEGDRVTGIVDFGAMKIDNVATDIQRLLGSMAGNDRESWHHGITAYEVTSPLAREELRLIETLDRSTLLLSGMNWLRWLFLDNRQFDDLSAAIVRLHTIRDRLAGV